MLTAEAKKDLFKKVSEKRKEISQLQVELNSVNDKKENSFKKKTELTTKISSLINEIKKSRSTRNDFTKQVKKDKVERDKQNKSVKASVDKIKELEKERDDLLRKHNIKDPTSILKQIAAIDVKIETEPMSFDKEKKLMKEIKGLKKKLKEAESVSHIISKIHSLSEEIDTKKKGAQKTHKQVQTHAKKSQEKHEALIEASQEIEDIKKEEEASFKKFIDHKKRFNEINDLLKEKLKEMKDLNEKSSAEKVSVKKHTEKTKKKALEDKKISVEEKLKKGMKLTTEDLIAFQGNND